MMEKMKVMFPRFEDHDDIVEASIVFLIKKNYDFVQSIFHPSCLRKIRRKKQINDIAKKI